MADPIVAAPPAAPVVTTTAPPAVDASPAAAVVVESPAGAPGAPPPVAAAPAGTETPPAPVAAETPPPAPAISPEIREYIASLEQERSEARTQEDMRALDSAVSQYSQRLQTEQGFTPEQADYVAKREGQQAQREYRQAQFREGQINAAFEIGRQHGVDPRTLMNLPTPQAMIQAAAQAKAQAASTTELAALRAEVAALKAKLAPVQTFTSGAAAAQPGSSNYLEAIKSGKPLPSAAEIDKYVAQHMASRQG